MFWGCDSTCWSAVTAIATVLLILATAAQAAVTLRIARELKHASEVREKQLTARHLNEQWQRVNLLSITDPRYQAVAAQTYEKNTASAEIPVRGAIFYVLNMLYDLFHARKEFVDEEFYRHMMDDHINLLMLNNKLEVERILATNRGYSKAFRQEVKETMDRLQQAPQAASELSTIA